MALLDMYRTNIQRKRGEIASLQADKAKESKKISDASQKKVAAQKSASSTKSQSILKSKLQIISRADDDISKSNNKIASIDRKIAQKEKELLAEEKKLQAEQIKEDKKRLEINQRAFRSINTALDFNKHEHIAITQRQDAMHQKIEALQNLPEKINVLFLAANPANEQPLRLDEEARSIQEMIRKSEYRDSVSFCTRWAVRPLDIINAINEVKPAIVHFSGHGSTTDLAFQDNDGNSKLVTAKALAATISSCSEGVRLVFFNTCSSAHHAELAVESIDASIGMSAGIGDATACLFSSYFYSAIGFGKSLRVAFNQAKAALMLEGIPEENTPMLFSKDEVDPTEFYIIRPENE